MSTATLTRRPASEAIANADFNAPFTVAADRQVTDADDSDAYVVTDADPTDVFGENLTGGYHGFVNVSGVYSTTGTVCMQSCEVIGEDMTTAMLERPGTYVLLPVTVTDGMDAGELTGEWVIAHRPLV